MTNRHTRWDSVRIDDHVWNKTFTSKREILLTIRHSTSTFLTVTWSKFVTDLGSFDSSHLDLNKSLVFVISCEYNWVDITFFWMFKRNWLVFKCFLLWLVSQFLTSTVKVTKNIVWYCRLCFSNNDIISWNLVCWTNDTIMIKFVVGTVFKAWSFLGVWHTDFFLKALCCRISPVENGSKETSINSRLVQHDWILLVVAWITCNRDDSITACSELFEP